MRQLIDKELLIRLGLLVIPALFLALGVEGKEGAKLWSKLLKNSGYISVSFLIFSLSLSPVLRVFGFFKTFNRLRRFIGLAVFGWIFFHFLCFLMKLYLKKGGFPLDSFIKPVVYTGLLGFLLLLPLAATSNKSAIKKLGGKKWKALHRLVYVTEAAVFVHLLLRGGWVAFWAWALFLPLVIIQGLRLFKIKI